MRFKIANNTITYNYGLALLKIIMSFEVVVGHYICWDMYQNGSLATRVLYSFCGVAVPVFMTLAFWFSDIDMLGSRKKLLNRVVRLMIPHVFWAAIYYIIYRYYTIHYNIAYIYSPMDVIYQLLFGSSYNGSAWFQPVLISLTLLFAWIFRLLRNKKTFKICVAICTVAFVIQYFKLTTFVFDMVQWPKYICNYFYKKEYITYTVGRFFEMIPCAVFGIVLKKFSRCDEFYKIRKEIVCASVVLLIIWVVFYSNIKEYTIDGYGYQGIGLSVISVAVIIVFMFMNFNKFSFLGVIIKELSQYTMTIYFVHRLVAETLYTTKISEKFYMVKGSLYDCSIIFVFSLLLAMVINFAPKKIIKRVLV